MSSSVLQESVLDETGTGLFSDKPEQKPLGEPVALVCMPWGSVVKPSLAMAILKKSVQNAGFSPDLHFLNIQFARRIGLDLYEKVSGCSTFQTEWFFSQFLFGPDGSAEIQNSWGQLQSNPEARPLLDCLERILEGSEESFKKILADIPPFIDECMAKIDWTKYMVVGFTTTFAQSLASLLLAKRIREIHPHVKIVMGGANVDSEMGVEFMRGFDWVDYVVHGEAENSFPALLKNTAVGRLEDKVPGVTLRAGGQLVAGDSEAAPVVDLNESPVPDYSDYVRQLEQAGLRKKINLLLYFESSRGCWWGAKHHCTFCGLNGSTMAFRKKDPARVYEEIVELSRKNRCLSLFATDNILANEYFAQLLPRLSSLDTDISLFYEVKANLTREQVKALSAAGIRDIQPGIESFNTRILQLMRKGVTGIQNIQLLKWCFEYGVAPGWNLLYGFPGETPQDYNDLPQLIRLLMHFRPPNNACQVLFERFSPYYFDKERFGLQIKARDEYRFIFPQTRVEMDKIAYFFEGNWQGQVGKPDDYIGPTKEAVELWRKHWSAGDIFCHYEKGLDHIVIHDNRPRTSSATIEPRAVYLNAQMSAMYLFCDENRSYRAVHQMMKQKFGDDIAEHTVHTWLDQIAAQGLMYREGDRYLSLAVRKTKKSRRNIAS